MPSHVHQTRGWCLLFLSLPLIVVVGWLVLFFLNSPALNLKLATGPALSFCLCLLKHQDYREEPPHRPHRQMLGIQLRSSRLHSQHLTTEFSPQSLTFTYRWLLLLNVCFPSQNVDCRIDTTFKLSSSPISQSTELGAMGTFRQAWHSESAWKSEAVQ